MPVYAIAQSKIEDRPRIDAYVERATPTLIQHNAKVLALDEAPLVIEGELAHPRTVIIEFDDEAAFWRWYDSPEYSAARKIREGAAQGTFILVRGF